MQRILSLTLTIALLSMPVVPVIGQEKSKTDTQTKTETKNKSNTAAKEKEETEEENAVLRQRALGLLRQAGDEAPNISDGRMASDIQAKAADLLWDTDKEAARKYFESAFDIAVKYYRDLKPEQRAGTGATITRGDYRMQVIGMAGRRDPELGRKFTDQYVEEKRREQQDAALRSKASNERARRLLGNNVDPVAEDLLESSMALFQTDPKMGMEMAERALSGGVPFTVAFFLSRLAGIDQASANEVYKFAINHVATDPNAAAGQLLLLSAYPFGENHVWINDGGGTSSWGFEVPKNFRIYPELTHLFFGAAQTVLARSLELDPAQSTDEASRVGTALFAAKILRPSVSRFEPEISESWDDFTTRLNILATAKSRDGIDQGLQNIQKQKSPRSSIDETDRIGKWLDQADKATNPVEKDTFYELAAIGIDGLGETDRALGIADKISDAEFRNQTKCWIYFDAAQRAIKDKKYDDARRYASKVEIADQSGYLYFKTAEAVLKDKDRARATELLDEATRRLASAEDSNGKLNALMGVAYVFSTFDTLRGFEAVGEVVRVANKLPNYNPEDTVLSRSLKANGRSGGSESFGLNNYALGFTLTSLARVDFDRSLLLAQSLESRLVRLSAVISITASVLENKKTIQGR